MSEELVSIAYEFSPLKAKLIQSRLEADGIECFVEGETVTSVAGPFSHATASWEHPSGNIEIRVRASDAATAKVILQEIEEAPHDIEEENSSGEENSAGRRKFLISAFTGSFVICCASVFAIPNYISMKNWIAMVIVGVLALCSYLISSFIISLIGKR